MTRGLNPPDTLSTEEVHTLRAVRRDIYYNGMKGGGVGLCGGIVLYTGAQWAKKLGLVQGTSLNRNTGLLTILSSFALGTFVAASTTGKELVHLLHPMFQTAGTDTTTNTTNDYSSTTTSSMSYQNRILLASNNTNESVDDDDEKRFDPQRLRELRVTRRKSLMDNLHTQGNGLSDSHSGRWVEENSETKFEKE